MKLVIKDKSRRNYDASIRDYYGTNALDQTIVKKHAESIKILCQLYKNLHGHK